MAKAKKYAIIAAYILLNLAVFGYTYQDTFSAIEQGGTTTDSTLSLFLFFRSLGFLIVFNFLIFLFIKIKKVDVKKYLE